MCVQFAIFNSSEKLHNIVEIGLEKDEVTVNKSLLEKKILGNKFSDTAVPLNNWGLMSTQGGTTKTKLQIVIEKCY